MPQIKDVMTGDVVIGHGSDILKSSAIGSCVVVLAYCSKSKAGGMVHVMLPGQAPHDDSREKTRYAVNAINELLNRMAAFGADIGGLDVCLVGAGNVLKRQDDVTARNNLDSVVEILKEKKIMVRAESVGGTDRRSAMLDIGRASVFYTVGEGKQTLLWSVQDKDVSRLNMAKLNLALKSAKMGVWQFNIAQGKCVFDDQACFLLGIKPAVFGGSADEFFAVVHPEDRAKLKAALACSIQSGAEYEVEYRVVRADGGVRYITTRGELIRDSKGDPQMINGIVWDTTERKQIEEALRASEEQYRSIVDNIGIGVALISPQMEILSLNKQMKQWNPHIDLKDKHICFRAFNDPPREDICSYCPTVKTLKDGKVHESVTETPMGSNIFNYRIVSSPVKDKEGNVVAAIEMVEDITERKRAEEAMKKLLPVYTKAS